MTRPLNINEATGEVISSNLVIYQGPDIPCINLCKGDSVTKVINKLATKLCNLLESLEVSNYDLTCLDLGNCPPETFEQLIQALINSICLSIETRGPAGTNGTNGNYVVTAYEPAGVRIRVHSGVTNLVIDTKYVCNGSDGNDGAQGLIGPPGIGEKGDPGISGQNGNYVIVTDASLAQCPTGGSVITWYNGTTDAVLSTSIVCNGSDATIIVQDEGIDLPTENTINFVGEGVTVTNAAGVNIVTIPYGLNTFYCLAVIDTSILDTTNKLFPVQNPAIDNGLADGKILKKYASITSNGVTVSSTTYVLNANVPACSFGTFDNEVEGEFTVTQAGHYLIQGSFHIKANNDGDDFWQSLPGDLDVAQIGLGILAGNATPNNLFGGDTKTVVKNIDKHIDLSTSIIAYLPINTAIRMGISNWTDRAYDGTAYTNADAIRFSITKLK